jgi:methyl-accepting chemotaxis protein
LDGRESRNRQRSGRRRDAQRACEYIPAVQQAFAARDRQPLLLIIAPVYGQLKQSFVLERLLFHTPPVVFFLRVHKPSKAGDELIGSRQTVVAASQKQPSVRGPEQGVAELGLRGVMPVT